MMGSVSVAFVTSHTRAQLYEKRCNPMKAKEKLQWLFDLLENVGDLNFA